MTSETSDMEFYVFGCLVTVVGLISLLFNGMILYLYKRAFKERNSRLMNIHLISLSLSSLGICSQFPLMAIACFKKSWIFGNKACDVMAYCGAIFSYAQIYTLTAIAIERFHGVKSLSPRSPDLMPMIQKTVTIWTLAILLASLPYFGLGDFHEDGIGVSCTFDFVDTSQKNMIYVILITLLGFTIPIIIIVFSYASIIKIVRNSNQVLRRTMRGENMKLVLMLRVREYAMAKTAAKTILAFVISWTPYACIALITVFGKPVPELIQTLAAIIAKGQTSLNAVIYVLGHHTFYYEILAFFGRDLVQNKLLATPQIKGLSTLNGVDTIAAITTTDTTPSGKRKTFKIIRKIKSKKKMATKHLDVQQHNINETKSSAL